MSSVVIPELRDRAPHNVFVTDLTDRMTVEWIEAHYDELLTRARAADSFEAWADAVRYHNELISHYASHSSRTSLAFRQASDDNAVVAEYQRFVRELSPALSRRDIEFDRLLDSQSPLDELEREFGPVWREQIRTSLVTNDPVNIELRSEVSDVLMEHTTIFGKLQIEWRGEQHPWSYTRKAAKDTDETERRAAHASMVGALQGVEADLERIYDNALRLRLQMSANLGIGSYIDLRYLEMGRIDWTADDAARYREGVLAHIVPLARELRAAQAAEQGAERVHPADHAIWPAHEQPELAVGVDEQLATTHRVLASLGDAFADPFQMLMDEHLIDLQARPGKGNGAFCTSFPDQRVPYLFCNSVGTPDDVSTLVHEFGHGLQTWRSRGIELVSLRFPTLEACEIHSMSLELLALPGMDSFFGADGSRRFALEQLRETVLLLPYVASVDEFQHAIYDPARSAPPNADERTELWRELTLRYRPDLDWDADPWWRDHRWLAQLHIFHNPFYYLDYALAQTVAWQLWLKSLDDRAGALETYLRLCDAGGTQPFRTLVVGAGLDDPFDPAVLARVAATLREHVLDASE